MKDLRDSFASQLLTAGVQLGYVSRQLGHSSPFVTADHYAKWCGGDDYRDPLTPGQGCQPSVLGDILCPVGIANEVRCQAAEKCRLAEEFDSLALRWI